MPKQIVLYSAVDFKYLYYMTLTNQSNPSKCDAIQRGTPHMSKHQICKEEQQVNRPRYGFNDERG